MSQIAVPSSSASLIALRKRANSGSLSENTNAAFADGHVFFLKNAMDLRAYQALASRNSGETVSNTDY